MFSYLHFSDAAKFADIARNIVNGNGFYSSFSFFDINKFSQPGLFSASFTPPAMPYAIAFFYQLFGISDTSVILTSLFFYFITILFTFLLARRLFGKLAGLLSSLAVATNINIWDYATSGASETLFMFEVVSIPYFILQRKKTTNLIALILMIICYFTRPQAFIFIAVNILFYLLLNFKFRKALVYWTAISVVGLLIDRLILMPLNGKYFLYSITGRGIHAVTQHTQAMAVSDVLRGVETQSSILSAIKKASLNLFNFYRSIPQIMNPYLFTLFLLSLVTIKSREQRSFTIITIIASLLSFLLAASTIPFYRYIHPSIPLIYIVGSATLVVVIRKYIKNRQYVICSSLLLMSVLVFLLSISTYLHDLRFNNARSNVSKAPLYTHLSYYLRDNTGPNDLIVTNLDTWGSWYGERKTVWFPISPDRLEEVVLDIDAVYLTSYKIDDENYYMGEEWREIFNNPREHTNKFFAEHFEFVEEYSISASDNYENREGRSVLWVKRK